MGDWDSVHFVQERGQLQIEILPSLVGVLGDLNECSEELDGIVPDARDAFSLQIKGGIVCLSR